MFFFPLKTKKRVVLLSRLSCELRFFSRIFHKNDRKKWDVQIAKKSQIFQASFVEVLHLHGSIWDPPLRRVRKSNPMKTRKVV